ncbi:hypothetical protein GQ53DRAFT_747296 [Thozetella sp. PMI_491]|nr:hypothetical protein GQ53DRAFT_747296 [Thozetella sp. PMI_491]
MFIKFEEELSQALRGKQRAFGTHAPETLDVLDLMPGLENDRGNIWGSLALRLELLERSEKEPGPGPQHARTIMARRELANHYMLHECRQEALQCLQAVQEAERNNGAKDPWTAAEDEAIIAEMHWSQSPDDHEAADRVLRAEIHWLDVCKATLGQDSSRTVVAMLSVATKLGLVGRRRLESTLMFWDATQIRRRIYGLDHPLTMDALESFLSDAAIYFSEAHAPQEVFDELVVMADAVYGQCKLSRGAYHPITINNLTTLSILLHLQGDMKTAHNAMWRVWRRSKYVYGVEHPLTKQARDHYNIFGEDLDVTVDIMRLHRSRQTPDLTSLENIEYVRRLLVL